MEDAERDSLSAASGHLRRLGNMCETREATPSKLARMNDKQVGEFLATVAGRYEERELGRETLRSYLKTLTGRWAFNGVEVTRRVRLARAEAVAGGVHPRRGRVGRGLKARRADRCVDRL